MPTKAATHMRAFSIVLICVLVMTACSLGADKTNKNKNSVYSEDSLSVTELSTDNETISNFDLLYSIYVPAYSADEYLDITEYSLPNSIDGLTATQLAMLDREHCLLQLSPTIGSNVESSSQLGIYNILNCTYETLYVQQPNEVVGVCHCDSNIIVLKSVYHDGKRGELKFISTADKACRIIYELNTNPIDGLLYTYYSTNGIYCDGKNIYFDDISDNDDGATCWKVYCYNIVSGKCDVIAENAQNPIPYGNDVILFTQNNDGRYNVLTSVSGMNMYEVGLSLRSISSNSKNLFCLATPLTSHNEMCTFTELRDLINNKIILSTDHTISNLVAGERYVSFINYTDEYVCIYDITNGCLLVADKLPKGMSYVFTHGECGSIVLFENGKARYFYFEAKQ